MRSTRVFQAFCSLIFIATLARPLPANAPLIPPASAALQLEWGKLPLYFIPNQGQMDERVAFYVHGHDKTLYFTAEGVTLALADLNPVPLKDLTPSPSPDRRGERSREHWVVKLDFMGANPVAPIGQAPSGATVSYFKGTPKQWHTGLPTYSKVVYPDLWPGIDLAYSGTIDRLKYEFVVQPGADPQHIRLAYGGATVSLGDAGELEVNTPIGSFQDAVPLAYQDVDGRRRPISVRYALEDATTYGFRLGEHDSTLPLVIDPAVLVYCGFIGGSTYDTGNAIAVDLAGNAYITGYTESTQTTFPETVGPDLTYNGNEDAFVAKVSADGRSLVYAGYIGGSDDDEGAGIAVDSAGIVYVTGFAGSSQATFPVTGGPDLTYNSDWDAFVAKLSADGTSLIYAGYIGGNDEDRGNAIAIDTTGYAYIVGMTYSDEATFPDKTGPDLDYNGDWDAFVAKVEADGSGLVYAGYIGGSSDDIGTGITVDTTGNAYISGYTESTEVTFPEMVGPDLTSNGNEDAFVAKVKADGSSLLYCGFIGGDQVDRGYGIALDTDNNAYIAGVAVSTQATFPVAVGPDMIHNGSNDAFVAKVKADGKSLLYAGYVGGSSSDWANVGLPLTQ